MPFILEATPVVTEDDVTSVLTYGDGAVNVCTPFNVAMFLRDVSCGIRPATEGAVKLAKAYWALDLAAIKSLIKG